MGFLAPLSFLFALSVPILLILYMLKVKRAPRRISSTFLWRAAIEETRASHPFQKLRNHPLLPWQILALLALTLALARPTLSMMRRETQTVAVLVDVSASMAMREGGKGPTRLEEAIEKASSFIGGLPGNSQISLITFADHAEALVPMTTDRARVTQALAELRPRASRQALDEAFSLAASLLTQTRNPRVAVFTDQAAPADSDWRLLGGSTPVTVEVVGTQAINRGWTAFDLRRKSAGGSTYDLFGQVALFNGPPHEVAVKIMDGERVLDARRVALEPGAESGVVLEGIELPDTAVIHAEIEPVERGLLSFSESDALPFDDQVWAPITKAGKTRVLVCTPGNLFLLRALDSMEEVETIVIAPGADAPPGEYDLAIYDRGRPATAPPLPSLQIAISPWDAPEAETKVFEPGGITHWDREDPASANTEWSTVDVFEAREIAPPADSRTLVSSEDRPLVIAGRAQGERALILAFDLFQSNFPLRAGFPIFISDAVKHLTEEGGRRSRVLKGGELYQARVPSGWGTVELIGPNAQIHSLRPGPDNRVSFAGTDAPGLWKLHVDGKVVDQFGVNLLSRAESDPALTQSITMNEGGEKKLAGLGEELKTNREIWHWVAWLALAALLVEWTLYQRRATRHAAS